MSRREAWGAGLIGAAALCWWAGQAVIDAYRAAARKTSCFYIGAPGDAIAFRFLLPALVCGAAGLILLVPALLRRIPRKVPRHIVGWIVAAASAAALLPAGALLPFAVFGSFGALDIVKLTVADGTAVLVAQDGFDGDTVVIYTERDEYHCRFTRDASEISGWPRVKDRDCRLIGAGRDLRLLCGGKALMVYPEAAAK